MQTKLVRPATWRKPALFGARHQPNVRAGLIGRVRVDSRLGGEKRAEDKHG